MALPPGVDEVQGIVGYNYSHANLVVQALTAAGADEANYDGNRKLAQLGESLIQFVLVNDSFGSPRGEPICRAPSAWPPTIE